MKILRMVGERLYDLSWDLINSKTLLYLSKGCVRAVNTQSFTKGEQDTNDQGIP
jgi:hypothetical protein